MNWTISFVHISLFTHRDHTLHYSVVWLLKLRLIWMHTPFNLQLYCNILSCPKKLKQAKPFTFSLGSQTETILDFEFIYRFIRCIQWINNNPYTALCIKMTLFQFFSRDITLNKLFKYFWLQNQLSIIFWEGKLSLKFITVNTYFWDSSLY